MVGYVGLVGGMRTYKDTPTSLQNMLKFIQFNQTKPQVTDTPLIVDILRF